MLKREQFGQDRAQQRSFMDFSALQSMPQQLSTQPQQISSAWAAPSYASHQHEQQRSSGSSSKSTCTPPFCLTACILLLVHVSLLHEGRKKILSRCVLFVTNANRLAKQHTKHAASSSSTARARAAGPQTQTQESRCASTQAKT